LHERSASAIAGPGGDGRVVRSVLVMEPLDRALVLGSSQPLDVADLSACRRERVSVVRRRSGGGAVLVEPGAQLWVDIVVPAGDALWEADVAKAAWWVGEVWAEALKRVGLSGLAVWKGPYIRRPSSDFSCFATLAAGEVTWLRRQPPRLAGAGAGARDAEGGLASLSSAPLAAGAPTQGAGAPTQGAGAPTQAAGGSPKVVGIAQRRTRSGVLLQCSCLLRWEPGLLLRLLRLKPAQRDRAAFDLLDVASAVPVGNEVLLDALLASLPGGVVRGSESPPDHPSTEGGVSKIGKWGL
jgi:lipoate-protein ligase A